MKKAILSILMLLGGIAILQAQAPRIPLVEHFTNTRCGRCPSGNNALFGTLDNLGDEVLHIAYHSRVPYTSCIFYQHNRDQANARRDRYSVGATPQAMLNGTYNGGGTGMLTTAEANAAAQGGSPIGIEVINRWIPGDTFEVGVNVHFDQALPNGNYGLFVAIVEADVSYNAPNGEQNHRNVFRAMLPNDNGEAIPLLAAGQSTGFYSFKIAKHADWQKTPIKAIAFVQNLQTDEVINAGTEGTFATGIEGGIDPGVRIAPNPATDYVSIDWASEILPSATLSLIDMQGRVLDQQEDIRPGHRINTTSIPAGIYAIKLSQGADSWAKKVVIR